MAKKKKGLKPEEPEIKEVPNLLELLTPPGKPGCWENKVTIHHISPRIKFSTSVSSQNDILSTPKTSSAADTIELIRADGLQCKACDLYKSRTNFVLGEGNLSSPLVFIGEAPGADEDASGRPFVGRAGQHLDKILTAAGFKREEVYICNILKCRPPDNRAPTVNEMNACTFLLKRQLELIRPQIIGLLGNIAVKYVVGPDAPGITKIHGQWFNSIFDIPSMPMYHPSYLLRYPSREKGSYNWQMWQDIQALKKRYDEIVGKK